MSGAVLLRPPCALTDWAGTPLVLHLLLAYSHILSSCFLILDHPRGVFPYTFTNDTLRANLLHFSWLSNNLCLITIVRLDESHNNYTISVYIILSYVLPYLYIFHQYLISDSFIIRVCSQ